MIRSSFGFWFFLQMKTRGNVYSDLKDILIRVMEAMNYQITNIQSFYVMGFKYICNYV